MDQYSERAQRGSSACAQGMDATDTDGDGAIGIDIDGAIIGAMAGPCARPGRLIRLGALHCI